MLARPKDVYGRDHADISTRSFCVHGRREAVVRAAVDHLQAHRVADEIWRLQIQRHLKQALPRQRPVEPSAVRAQRDVCRGSNCLALSMRGFQEIQTRVPRDDGLLQMMTTGDGVRVTTLSPLTEAPHAATVEIAPGSFLQKDEHTIYHVTAL